MLFHHLKYLHLHLVSCLMCHVWFINFLLCACVALLPLICFKPHILRKQIRDHVVFCLLIFLSMTLAGFFYYYKNYYYKTPSIRESMSELRVPTKQQCLNSHANPIDLWPLGTKILDQRSSSGCSSGVLCRVIEDGGEVYLNVASSPGLVIFWFCRQFPG